MAHCKVIIEINDDNAPVISVKSVINPIPENIPPASEAAVDRKGPRPLSGLFSLLCHFNSCTFNLILFLVHPICLIADKLQNTM